jgi:hypothetical protein
MRILLAARKDLTASGTAQTNRLLRALLLAGGDTECRLARGELADLTLPSLARHRHLRARARTCGCREPGHVMRRAGTRAGGRRAGPAAGDEWFASEAGGVRSAGGCCRSDRWGQWVL